MPSKKKSTTKSAQSAAFPKPISVAQSQKPEPSHQDLSAPPLTSPNASSTGNADLDLRTGDTTESAGEPTVPPNVNRKKQKRREKEAARRLADQQAHMTNGRSDSENHLRNSHPPPAALKQGRGPVKGYFTEEPDYVDMDYPDPLPDQGPDDAFYSNDEDADYIQDYASGPDHSWLNTSKRKKTSKKRPRHGHASTSIPPPSMPRPNLPTLSNAALRSAHRMSSDHIWNTSTQAERENIKQFWLELGEEERRSLVRVEKEAVLRKMKEQQKHSCSCSVCGRKRTAIEEELEVLYDAYYQELEQFANHNQDLPETSPMPHPRTIDSYRNRPHQMAGAYPVQGRIHEIGDDGQDLDDEDDYDDEEDDEDQYSDDDDDDYEDDLPPGPSDFLQFGNSLTVKDGILTVADDLLKNNGKHFIDMMEQLAERRMQREEDIHYPAPPLTHHSSRQGHNHSPIDDDDDDDYDDEEDDEDYDSQDEDDYEGDEMDSMTEEQRMEEGRRMFQIFAARMFEQRVLTAYKEKVAIERQQKLLEELEEELRLDDQREAKKQKDAAKKKEKKARQKAAKDEEKAKKDAEKLAAEKAAREAEEKKAAERKSKQEEQRKKREAERKAAEEERLKKEAEKLQRQAKERERQQEMERKAKEAKERERKQKEEARRKEKEEREAKEAEAKERRQKEDAERKSRQEQAQRERQASKHDKNKPDAAPRPQPIALPPGLQPVAKTSHVQSPNFPTATPIIPPEIPTPVRSRQPSQPSQPSQSSSPKSHKGSTEQSQASASPSNASIPAATIQPTKNTRQGPPLYHPQPSAPRSPLNNVGRSGHFPFSMNAVGGMGMNGMHMNGPPGMQHMPPPMPMHQAPPNGMNQRYPPNGMAFPPGLNGHRPFQPMQQMPFHPPASSGPFAGSIPAQVPKPQMHSRQTSGSESSSQPAPISRPGPIARPSSTTPDKQRNSQSGSHADIDKITTQLGSSALLDDSDEPFVSQLDTRTNLAPVGPPGSSRIPFASSFPDKSNAFGGVNSSWPASFNHNVPNVSWSHNNHRSNSGWPQPSSFDPLGPQPGIPRSHVPRPIAVRLMLVQACRQLNQMQQTTKSGDGSHPVREVLRQVETIKPPTDPSVSMDEMLGICDTEGNVQNGGGTFEVMMDPKRGQIVKFVEDSTANAPRAPIGVAGDIGSPRLTPGQHQMPQQGQHPPQQHFGSHFNHFGGVGSGSNAPIGSSFGSIGQGVAHLHQQQGQPGHHYPHPQQQSNVFGLPGRNF